MYLSPIQAFPTCPPMYPALDVWYSTGYSQNCIRILNLVNAKWNECSSQREKCQFGDDKKVKVDKFR